MPNRLSVLQRLSFFKPRCSRKVLLLMLTVMVAGTAYSLERSPSAAIEPSFFLFLEKFHGHTCAGSLMGARLGLAAKSALKAAGGDGKLKARYFDLSCPVDGIQVAAGTTHGNHAIEVLDRNEHRLLLWSDKNDRQVEARLTKTAEEKGKTARDLKNKARELPPGPERQRMEKAVEDLFSWFKNAPEADVVQVKVVK